VFESFAVTDILELIYKRKIVSVLLSLVIEQPP